MFTCRKIKPEPSLSPCTQINSKWIRDLSVIAETLTILIELCGIQFKTQHQVMTF